MYRIDNAKVAIVLPSPSADGPNPGGFFTPGDPNTATPATPVDAEWLNMVQEEIAHVIADADGGNTALSKATRTQLKTAIKAMITAQVTPASVVRGVRGLNLGFVNTTTLSIAAGSIADDTGVKTLSLAGTQNIVITNTGANGSQTGSAPTTAPVYIYLIGDNNSGTNGANGTHATAGFISNSASPTLPSGYDVKNLIGAWLTNGSAQLRAGTAFGNGASRKVIWDDMPLVMNGVSPSSWTSYSFSSYLPSSLTQELLIDGAWNSGNSNSISDFRIRKPGSSASTGQLIAFQSTGSGFDASGGLIGSIVTDASGAIQAIENNPYAAISVYARGFAWEI